MAIEFSGHHRPATIPPPAPPHVPGAQDPYQLASSALFALCAAAIGAMPGALLGAGVAWVWWRLTRAPGLWRWLIAGLAAVVPGILYGDILWAWSWRWLAGSIQVFPQHFHWVAISPDGIRRSVAIEAGAGPLLLQAATLASWFHDRSLGGHMDRRHKREVTRDHALNRDMRRGLRGISSLIGAAGKNQQQAESAVDAETIRLGFDAESTQPFDLAIAELRQHVFVPGASGSGKSTTLMRLADGVMKAGWAVVIVDCKGTGLLSGARELAQRHNCPLLLVNPADPQTYGYNPCIGDGPDIANKLVGAFSFGDDAQIYKNISSYVLSVTVDAMHRSGEEVEVNLATLIEALGRGGLSDLASKLPQDDPVRRDLIRLDTAPTELEKNGIAGMVARLRALATGRFGPVFRAEPYVNWDHDTAEQSVLFFALPTTGAPEDVALMGRVLAQDLKQLCDRRLQAVNETDAEPLPILLIFDEFAKLGEAEQIVDLLLQARQAHISLVLATQLLPKEEAIRKPAIQSGVLIIHRVEAEDAEKLAAELGTRRVPEHTWAPGMSPEETDRLSVRMVDEYTIHPNVLRRLTKPGRVAVRSVLTDRDAIVQVSKPFAE